MSAQRSISLERRRTTGVIADEIRRELDAADVDFRSGVQHAIRAGELLLEAKQRVVHGQWLSWVTENVPLSARHAQRLMQLTANAPSVAHLATMTEAMAVLAEPKALSPPAPDDEPLPAWAEPPADRNLLGEPVLSPQQRERIREEFEGLKKPSGPEREPPRGSATDKQRAYLKRLCSERGVEMPADPLSKGRVSKLIDELQLTPPRLRPDLWLERLERVVEDAEAAVPAGAPLVPALELIARLTRAVDSHLGGGTAPPPPSRLSERTDDELQEIADAYIDAHAEEFG